ncbi:alpha/beta hydrolase family protein [Marinibaculum pumilum]|uniref:Alpha/beta hydrolase family protein n=1 Tax=Marinibaculum pumilum TaxID=1766165 RepID=A0ABV7L5C0_9PROT
MASGTIAPFATLDFNSQLNRSLGKVYLGAASVGEVMAVAASIADGDTASWHAAWSKLAASLEARGRAAAAAGQRQTALGLYLRATEAWRQACFFHRVDLDCAELQAAWPRLVACFRAALAQSPFHGGRVELPFEGRSLWAYLLHPGPAEDGPWPTLVMPSGYDGTAEETAVMVGWPALARGYAVLAFDGPGQGCTLYDPARRAFMRPDFEHVLPAVVDAAQGMAPVDGDRIAGVGISFGGYLMPRGASGEPRLKALVADPGQVDMGAAILQRLPERLKALLDQDGTEAEAAFEALVARPEGQLLFWPRMAAHGLSSVQAYIRAMRDFSLAGRAERIACPCLICDNEIDVVSTGQGSLLAGMLETPAEFVRFTAAEGAGGHCEGAGREVFDERVFPWLDRLLKR